METLTRDEKWTTKYPGLGIGPVPIEPYISSAYFERERKQIFRQTWLHVGRVEEIPEVGDYFVKTIAVCQASVIVVRGKDGTVRAFHNICSHRGNQVSRACAGSAPRFVCGFHGWTFDLEGQLIYVPDQEQFFDLNKSEYGLTPLVTETWAGFIFIHFDPNPKETLRAYLGELVDRLDGYPFAALPARYAYQAELKANWKIGMDAFQEAYHALVVHHRSVGGAYASKENPFIHALDFHLYRFHRTTSIPSASSYQPTAVQAVSHRFGASIVKVADEGLSRDRLPPGLNLTRSPQWAFEQIILFPNFSLFLFEGTYITYQFWPLAVDRTLWEIRNYYPVPENAGQRFSQEYAKCALRDTLMEDGSIIEATHAALASRVKTHLLLQDQELLVRHFHKVLNDVCPVEAES